MLNFPVMFGTAHLKQPHLPHSQTAGLSLAKMNRQQLICDRAFGVSVAN